MYTELNVIIVEFDKVYNVNFPIVDIDKVKYWKILGLSVLM